MVMGTRTRVYMDGTCKLVVGYERVKIKEKVKVTNLKATMMCPLLDTGFAFSRYAVKLSSRQRTSGWVEPAGKEGERGEFGGA